MKVYRIDTFPKPPRSKFDYYAQLDCKRADERFLDDSNFEGRPFPNKWRRVVLHFSEPQWPRADFYNFSLGNFVCTERARSLMGSIMSKAGEFLPVFIEGEEQPHYLYNVTDCGSYIDPIRSIWQCNINYPERLANPTTALLAAPAFDTDKIRQSTIFKIPQKSEIYCVEQTGRASSSEFKALVEHHKLTGLRFQLAWSAAGGPVPKHSVPTKDTPLVWLTGGGERYRKK